MFTGIIEEVGTIRQIDQKGENRRIVVEASKVTQELKTGDSCAVSGVCLTALDITPTSFAADLAPETWVRTSLSRIHPGAKVNLELPLAAHGRLGGHIVQGHVDGVGKLEAFESIKDSDGYWLHIQVPAELEKYLVFKGSIAIEGISLTVAKLEGLRCSVAIIPHTVEMTNLGTLKPGDPVNLETDIVAKYLEKWVMRDRPEGLSAAALVAKGF
jgi:riboflavin synthase